MADSRFRNELQALRNQAKARGHASSSLSSDTIEQKAFQTNQATVSHPYVIKDLARTGIFVLFILCVLFVLSLELSTLPEFATLRSALHIHLFAF